MTGNRRKRRGEDQKEERPLSRTLSLRGAHQSTYGVLLAEEAQPSEVRADHGLLRLDLGSEDQPPMLLHHEVHLGAVVGAPVEDPRFAPAVVDPAQGLEHDPLLEQPAARHGVQTGRETVREGVGDAGVEQVEARVGDQPGADAAAPGLEPKPQKRVLEDLEVLLGRARRQRRVPTHGGVVDHVPALGCDDVEESRDPPQVAHQGFGLDLLLHVGPTVGLEKVPRLGLVAGDNRRQAAQSQRPLQIEEIALLRDRKRVKAPDRREKRFGPGRPGVMKEIERIVVRCARENPSWDYRRIEGALSNLGHRVARATVSNILRRHGLDPAPERGRHTPWRTLLGAHWTTIAAIDFTTVEVWCRHGLVTFYVLFVLELSTRRVHCAGVTPGPDERWMMQIGRNLTDCFLEGKHFVIMDRDSKYTDAFRALLTRAGVQAVRLPARSPNLNAWIEGFVRSIKEECLDRMIFFGESSLRCAVREFIAHYHAERNHQGLDNRIIQPDGRVARASGPVRSREHLGGILRYYYRDAA